MLLLSKKTLRDWEAYPLSLIRFVTFKSKTLCSYWQFGTGTCSIHRKLQKSAHCRCNFTYRRRSFTFHRCKFTHHRCNFTSNLTYPRCNFIYRRCNFTYCWFDFTYRRVDFTYRRWNFTYYWMKNTMDITLVTALTSITNQRGLQGYNSKN